MRVIRPASGADVALALLLSMLLVSILLVTTGLAAFTMLCWKVGSDLGALPLFPSFQGFLKQRESWLLLATLAWLFAKLIDVIAADFSNADRFKERAGHADGAPADGLCPLVVAPE